MFRSTYARLKESNSSNLAARADSGQYDSSSRNGQTQEDRDTRSGRARYERGLADRHHCTDDDDNDDDDDDVDDDEEDDPEHQNGRDERAVRGVPGRTRPREAGGPELKDYFLPAKDVHPDIVHTWAADFLGRDAKVEAVFTRQPGYLIKSRTPITIVSL